MREYELEPEARVRTRTVSRSVVDDISTWWNGPDAVRQPKPEKPFTKQDFDQQLALVFTPVSLSHQDIFGKKPDPATCKAAGGRLGPAAAALQVIANAKRDPKHQATILAPLPDIQAAQTTLQVMGDDAKAPDVWHEAFQTALQAVDAVIALPVIDPDSADPPPADGVTQRDHDLLEASVKPTVQRLAKTTSLTPGLDWDPRSYTEGNEALMALGAVSHPKLKPAVDAVQRGIQAITAYIKTLEANVAAVSTSLESAMQKLSQSQVPYVDEVAAESEPAK